MIYGPDSPGNYQRLYKLALKLPFYPNIDNKRSMLYIGNLSIYIDYYIQNNITGIELPQNKEYVNTTYLINEIRKNNNKKIRSTKIFNLGERISKYFIPPVSKMFGNLYYTKETIVKDLIDLSNSIRESELE